MSFGYQREPEAYIGDSHTLNAYIYEDDDATPVSLVELSGVTFTVRKPSDSLTSPSVNAVPGIIPEDGLGQYIVQPSVITEAGQYRSRAQFTFTDGRVKTVVVNFLAVDPDDEAEPQPADPAIDLAWDMLEDCFDAETGPGPWLRDMSLSNFDKAKMRRLIPMVLMEINATQPQSNYTEGSFPYTSNDGLALVAQGVLVATIRHLMRSYTEQPIPQNSGAAFLDRTRYAQAWKFIYDVEEAKYKEWLYLFKLRTYAQGSISVLVGAKAGRLLPAPLRARNIGRGFY